MTLRRWLLGIGSVALTVFLVFLLLKVGKIHLRETLKQLRSVSWLSFAKLLLLNCLLVYLSTEKWRSIDAAWRRSADTTPSRATAFAHTSSGLALGVFLPVQLALSTARTFGTHVHGGALKRGAAGTLFEQGFDILTVCFLAAASGITRFYGGGGLMWALAAAAASVLAVLFVGPSVRLIRRFATTFTVTTFTVTTAAPGNKVRALLASLSELQHSGILNAALGRRLVILSILRFIVVVLMSIETAEAVGVHISVWQMAASLPFVVLASVLALTPGGLGVNELTSVTALKMFGIPLAEAAQWAIANRVLIAVSYFMVALSAAIFLCAERILTRGTAGSMQPPRKTESSVEQRQSL